MKRIMQTMVLAVVVFLTYSSVLAANSYEMVDYYPITEGNVWFFDRDINVVGTETHSFGQYQGIAWHSASDFRSEYGFVYNGQEGLLMVGLGVYDSSTIVDLSDTPFVWAHAEMEVGQSVESTIPAGKLGDDEIKLTSTLMAVETVIVPAGTFQNCLKFRVTVNDSPSTQYTEHVWLAKDIGVVKMYRVSEIPVNHEGCFFTCGSFDEDFNSVEEREIVLESSVLSSDRSGDINGDGRISLDDVIHALQILSATRF
jgi:hypothetical protein